MKTTVVRTVRKLRALLPNEYLVYEQWVHWAAQLEDFSVVARRIGRCQDSEAAKDYLAEIRYASLFYALNFAVRFEPEGTAGPDVGVRRDGHDGRIEVARFRHINSGPPPLSSGRLAIYGDPERDVAKAITKVVHKFRQFRGGCTGVVALWGDDGALDHSEVRTAVRDISEARGFPHVLAGVLYGSVWKGGAERKQFYFFPTEHADDVARKWGSEIETHSLSSISMRLTAISAQDQD